MRLYNKLLSQKIRRGLFNIAKITTAILFPILNLPLINSASASIPSSMEKYFSCTDMKVIWARESGAALNDVNYQDFEQAFTETLENSGYSFSFYELSREGGFDGYYYSAPGIGIQSTERFKTSLGALVSGGESYGYGESVEAGSNEANAFIEEYLRRCPNSKIILGGFSQGGQTVSRTLQKLSENSINHLLYAATFGDPKLHLPEGQGLFPVACQNKNLSDYRAYVPDCHVYQGVLGGYDPYNVDATKFAGKVGAYCRYHDVICGVYTDIDNWYDGHANYRSSGLYSEAAKTALSKLAPTRATSSAKTQNLALLFDVTGSMQPMFERYKNEAINLAKRVFDKGGKVAVYLYGDLEDYEPTELCNFETCNLETISEKIAVVENSGGDEPESLLSASYNLMRRLKWDNGANKSIVVFTDAGFHNPDRDKITLDQVVELSLKIDPVNFYVLSQGKFAEEYQELVSRTNGKFYYDTDSETILADIETDILVHEEAELYNLATVATLSEVSNLIYEQTSEDSAKISFDSTGAKNILILNDQILGIMDETEIEITDLDFSKSNIVTVAPLSSDGYRGASLSLSLFGTSGFGGRGQVSAGNMSSIKAPNSGAR